MSDLMRAFLQSWLDWVIDGAPAYAPYSRANGLCESRRDFPPCIQSREVRYALGDELSDMFNADELDEVYPFGEAAYDTACFTKTQHQDETRLRWVCEKLGRDYESVLKDISAREARHSLEL
jgi:hypothetical protein